MLHLNTPVSSGFAELVNKTLIKFNAPIDPSLQRRMPTRAARHSLAFSGGVDSVAALALMPEDTVSIFTHRRPPPNNTNFGNYRSDAALHSCEHAKRLGYDVHIVNTSFEYVRKPVGFPCHWSVAIPTIMSADHLDLKSVSYGMVLESAFHLGGASFSKLTQRSTYTDWAPLFDYVGMPMCYPTAGLSEVLTSKIYHLDGRFQAQSCVRGSTITPCGNCFKCFRKGLMESAIYGTGSNSKLFDIPLTCQEVSTKLLATPIHHEIGFAWALTRCSHSDHEIFLLLKKKLEATSAYGNNLDFLTRFYPQGLQFMPEDLRCVVETNLNKFTTKMSTDDIKFVHDWNVEKFLSQQSYIEGQNELSERLLRGLDGLGGIVNSGI